MKFGITYFSPEYPEMEICRRIEVAAQNIGVECFFINPNGKCLQNKKYVTDLDLDFMIVFDPRHVRFYDIFTYHLHWFAPGLCSVDSLSFYDALSENCDDHLFFPSPRISQLFSQKYISTNSNYLFPSVPYNYVQEPLLFSGDKDAEYKVFYAGINVEKQGENAKDKKKNVRHSEIFGELDSLGILALFGPRVIDGKKNWEGYKSYQGEIPFDGSSVINIANKAGITLAIHHKVHKSYGMLTNRVFEGLAAGNLVITDKTQFVDEVFGDTVFTLGATMSEKEKAQELLNIVQWANKNPKLAWEKAVASQKIFLEKFELTAIIQKLCQSHQERTELLRNQARDITKDTDVTVVLEVSNDECALSEQVENIIKQDYYYCKILVVSYGELQPNQHSLIQALLGKYETSYIVIPTPKDLDVCDRTPNSLLYTIKEYISTDTFCFCVPHQYWHSNHISSLLVESVKSNSAVIYSGTYNEINGTHVCINEKSIDGLTIKLMSVVTSTSAYYWELQKKILKSAVLVKTKLLYSLSTKELRMVYCYEHIVLAILAVLSGENLAFSKKITVCIKDTVAPSIPLESDTRLYYEPTFIAPGMAAGSLLAMLRDIFLNNDIFKNKLYAIQSKNFLLPQASSCMVASKTTKLKKKYKNLIIINAILTVIIVAILVYYVFAL